LLVIPAGGAREPASQESIASNRHTVHMPDGAALFRHAVVGMATACSDLLSKADLKIDDVDVVVPHQANARIIAAVAKRLGVSDERLVVDVADVGNTSAASIPIALESTWRSGRLQPGSILLTVAFGAGLAWGANLIRWTAEPPSDQAAGLETG